ncbi:MAG: branched-chain amino acid ABC transporter permease [Gammaproteobacteria bacterium]|nr:branched-chain amino acid ABC transporter permease [Gammaproteobacteria bacterium]
MSQFGNVLVSIIFDGLAYAMILFIISVGLSITMGLMGFVNLAHGVFAMAGGYFTVSLMTGFGVGFIPALLLAAIGVAVTSLVLERLLYAPLYDASELDQVLLSIGLVFMASATFTFFFGPDPVSIRVPSVLSGQIDLGFRSFPTYRVFMIMVGLIMITVLWLGFERTIIGAKIRAAVDNRRMAESIGINVDRLFKITFALGSGIAAIGGGLAVDILGLSPSFAIQYLVLFLIVVAVGGLGTIRGTFVAAIVLGVIDNAGKYLWPEGGAFFIYAVTIAILLLRPAGLFGKE